MSNTIMGLAPQPARSLIDILRKFVCTLRPGQVFTFDEAKKYINENTEHHYHVETIRATLKSACVNYEYRARDPAEITKASNRDLFWKIGIKEYRLAEKTDEPFIYFGDCDCGKYAFRHTHLAMDPRDDAP
jgi:hypothetical protein